MKMSNAASTSAIPNPSLSVQGFIFDVEFHEVDAFHVTGERMKKTKEIEFTETLDTWREPGKRDRIQVEHCLIPSLAANSITHISVVGIDGLFLLVSPIHEAIHTQFPVLISFLTRRCMVTYPPEVFGEDRDFVIPEKRPFSSRFSAI
jgi:hypothetical protein